jgi:D-cysteine desulfhydrase
VVTCGGAQSAHAAAVAVAAAERGIAAHLVLRGELPPVLTGYSLIARLYATTISYVSRDVYGASVDRREALAIGAARAAAFRSALFNSDGAATPVAPGIIGEGGRDPGALLGLLRLVAGLAEAEPALTTEPMTLVVPAGTGTTAVGLALGVAIAGLPWLVVGVPIAARPAALDAAGAALIRGLAGVSPAVARAAADAEALSASSTSAVCTATAAAAAVGMRWGACQGNAPSAATESEIAHLPLVWVLRPRPRRFGVVLRGEVEACASIARSCGILLDPIYTLAAWEVAAALREPLLGATELALRPSGRGLGRVVLVHTGGTLGMMGVAQRYPAECAVPREA